MIVKNKVLHIVFIGRIEEEKGVDVLIDFIRFLNGNPSYKQKIRFSICGDGTRTSELLGSPGIVDLRNSHICREHLSTPSIAYYNFGGRDIQEIHLLYKTANFALMPSRFLETFGLSALEALSYGAPVVGFRKGGLISFIPQSLALNPSTPISSLVEIIDSYFSGVSLEATDISFYQKSKWMERLKDLLGKQNKISILHDYEVRIGGAERYVSDLREAIRGLGRDVSFFGYRKKTTPFLRRWMFITSIVAFWRGVALYKSLRISTPQVIWMHSILRYIGIWGILAVRYYSKKHPETTIFLSHHDVGLLAGFPQYTQEENDIPSDDRLSSFIPTNLSLIKQFTSIWKWCYVWLVKKTLPEDTKHIIFAPFLEVHIQRHFPGKEIILFPHSVDDPR